MNFWQVIMAMIWFFFFVLWIWIVIMVFVDNFRRTDHSGWAKAGWTVLIVFVPLLGVLIYLIARPKMTEEDKDLLAQADAAATVASGGGTGGSAAPASTTADELQKLSDLHNAGKLTDEEFATAKSKLIGTTEGA